MVQKQRLWIQSCLVRQGGGDHEICLLRRAFPVILPLRSNADLRPLIVCTISSVICRAYSQPVNRNAIDLIDERKDENALASLALSASNSYRLFPPSRSTTMRKAEDDLPDCWHETTESMWYDDVLPLSKTALAALFVVGMIYAHKERLEGNELYSKQRNARGYMDHRSRGCVRASRRSSASFCKWYISNGSKNIASLVKDV